MLPASKFAVLHKSFPKCPGTSLAFIFLIEKGLVMNAVADMLAHLQVIHEKVHFARFEDGEHGLTYVEGVPPVVILDRPVIFPDA